MSSHAVDIRKHRDGAFLRAAHDYPRHTATPRSSEGALPDASITIGTGYIRRVSTTQQTDQHGHNAMGNSNEAGPLPKFLAENKTICLNVNKTNVFEPRKAQLADMVGDERDAIA